jgi:hypothetical protein
MFSFGKVLGRFLADYMITWKVAAQNLVFLSPFAVSG